MDEKILHVEFLRRSKKIPAEEFEHINVGYGYLWYSCTSTDYEYYGVDIIGYNEPIKGIGVTCKDARNDFIVNMKLTLGI